MKNIFKSNYLALFLFGILILSACNKDDYYEDGGLAVAKYDGSIIQYLETKPVLFDSIVEIIKLAGLEETFQNEEFTFFAPADPDIKQLIGSLDKGGLNYRLFNESLDTIKQLSDIDSIIWKKHLYKYMFKGKNTLADYPQIDFDLLGTYPGQNYVSFSGNVSNIGVVYNDIVQKDHETEISRLKYQGYRQLYLSYIPDFTNPDAYINYPVSTSDIQPTNGVIHVLNYTESVFGLYPGSEDFINDVIQSKR